MTISRAQLSNINVTCFLGQLSADKLLVFNWSQAQLQVDFFAMFTTSWIEVNYEFINENFDFTLG